MSKSFIKLFSQLSDETKNFLSKSGNITNEADFNALEKSGKKVLDLYRKLEVEVKSLSNLSDKEKMQLLPEDTLSKVKKVEQALKAYNSAIDKNSKATQQAKNNLAKYEAQLEGIKAEQQALANKKIITGAEYSQATNDLKKYKEELKSVNEQLEGIQVPTNKNGGADKRTKEYKTQQQLLLQRDQLLTNIAQKEAIINNSTTEKRKATQIKNLNVEYQTTSNLIKNVQEELKKLDATDVASNSFQKLVNGIKQIEGLEDIQINSLDDVNRVIKDLTDGDVEKLNGVLRQLLVTLEQGDEGANDFSNGLNEAKESIIQMVSYQEEVNRMRQNLLNFFSIDNAVNLFKRAVRSAFETVKELDAAMTETAVVTDFSVGDMWDQLPRYTKAANELGTTTLGAYQTMTLFYQQGLKTNEVFEIGTETMKMARIANMDYADATDKMTAALRGFNMELNETSAQRVNDVYSELAAITAADTNEIATAMTKTASIADSANMEFETTAAFLSQIIETTRESAETAGTAMKTVVARFQELKKDPAEIGEVDGEIVDANKIETALRTINVALRDTSGQFRDLDDVFLEIASKWNTLDTNTQRYIATMAAGSRQQSRFIAMMSNYDRTMELVNAANNSAGASQKQFEKTTESLESKLNKLKNAWDAFTMGITNSTLIKTGVDLLTDLLSILNKLIDGISGESGLIKAIASIGIAWGGLKLGGNILKKLGFGDTLIGQSFSKLFPKKDGEKAGETLAESIKKGFKRASKKGEGLGLKGFFTNSNLDKDFDELVINLGKKRKKLLKENDDFREEYLNSLEINNSQFSDSQLLEVQMEFDTNGIEAANAKVKEFGGTIKVTDGMIEKSKDNLKELNTNFQNVGAAATLTGGILVGFGTILSEAGYEEAGERLQKIGAAFIGIGQAITILPTLFKPVVAKLVAGGLSVQAAWGWVTAIVVAVATLGAAIAFAISEAQKATIEGKIKAAEERTKAAKESAEKAKEAYDNLLNDKEKYSELQNTLDNLVKGTLEWKEALIEANQQVLNLLTTYPELAKHLQTGENGQIIIAEEGFEEILQNQIKGMKNAQAAVSMAQINEQQLKEEKANRELQKKFGATTGYFYFDNYVVPINSGSGVAVSYGAGNI